MVTQDISLLNPELCQKTMSGRYVEMDSQKLVESILSLTSKGEPVFELRSITMKNLVPSKPERNYCGEHMIRIKTVIPYLLDGEELYPEILIKNSYDGSGKFSVDMGVYRLVCTNGLVIKSHDFTGFNVRHMGTPEEVAFDTVRAFAKNVPKMVEIHKALAEREMSDEEKIQFAMKAAQLRWKKEFTAEQAEQLLQAQRPEDEGNSLWKVYNVIQEKAINGGVKVDGMKRKFKGVTMAAEDLKVNSALFNLAMSYITNDPEGQPQPEGDNFEKVEDVETIIAEEVTETPDLETVTIPEKPSKFNYIGEKRTRVPNPAYDRWMELYSDLV